MMEEEEWIEGGVIQEGHVAISSSQVVDHIMNALEAVCILGVSIDPSFVAKLGEIVVVGEQVEEPIHDRVSVSIQL